MKGFECNEMKKTKAMLSSGKTPAQPKPGKGKKAGTGTSGVTPPRRIK